MECPGAHQHTITHTTLVGSRMTFAPLTIILRQGRRVYCTVSLMRLRTIPVTGPVKLVTGGLNSRLFLLCRIRKYKVQQATNHCFPPLYPDRHSAVSSRSSLYASRPSETEYLEGKRGVFSPITRLLLDQKVHPHHQVTRLCSVHKNLLPRGLFEKKNLLSISFVRRRMSGNRNK